MDYSKKNLKDTHSFKSESEDLF